MGKLYNGFYKLKTAFFVLVGVLFLAILPFCGANPLSFLYFLVVFIVYLFVPGMFFYHLLKAEQGICGFVVSLSFALGAAFLTVLYCVSMLTGQLWALKLVPIIICAAFAVLLFKKKVKTLNPTIKKPQIFYLLTLVSALVFLFVFVGAIKSAHPSAVGAIQLKQDFMWNVGNANSFMLAFPPIDIRLDGVSFKYHFFVELLTASFSLVSGLSNYDILGFYLQPIMLLFLVIALYEFSLFFYKGAVLRANLFTASFFVLSCASLYKVLPNGESVFSVNLIYHLISNVNSVATSFIFLSLFMGLIINAYRRDMQVSLTYYAITLATFILLTFSKSPIAALTAIAMLVAVVFTIIFRKCTFKNAVFTLSIIAVFYLIYRLMFSAGGDASVSFSFVKTIESGYFTNYLHYFLNTNHTLYLISIPIFMLMQAFCISPFIVPVYFISACKALLRLAKLEFEQLVCYAAGVGGLLAFFLFITGVFHRYIFYLRHFSLCT